MRVSTRQNAQEAGRLRIVAVSEMFHISGPLKLLGPFKLSARLTSHPFDRHAGALDDSESAGEMVAADGRQDRCSNDLMET